MSDKLEKSDDQMDIANHNANHLTVAIIIAILATIVVPFGMTPLSLDSFNAALPFIMTIPPALAGLWVLIAGKGRRIMALAALVASAVMFFGTTAIISASSGGWSGYDAIKMYGWNSYFLFGLGATAGYSIMLWQLAAANKLKAWMLFAPLGLLAPWFWTGFRVYQDYHHL